MSSLKNAIPTHLPFLRKLLEEVFQQNGKVNQGMENPLQGRGEGSPEDDGRWMSGITAKDSFREQWVPGGNRRMKAPGGCRRKIGWMEYLIGLMMWKIDPSLHHLVELLQGVRK